MVTWCGAWANSCRFKPFTAREPQVRLGDTQDVCSVPSNRVALGFASSNPSVHFHTKAYVPMFCLATCKDWWAGRPDGTPVTSDTPDAPFLTYLATARTVRMVVAA